MSRQITLCGLKSVSSWVVGGRVEDHKLVLSVNKSRTTDWFSCIPKSLINGSPTLPPWSQINDHLLKERRINDQWWRIQECPPWSLIFSHRSGNPSTESLTRVCGEKGRDGELSNLPFYFESLYQLLKFSQRYSGSRPRTLNLASCHFAQINDPPTKKSFFDETILWFPEIYGNRRGRIYTYIRHASHCFDTLRCRAGTHLGNPDLHISALEQRITC